MDKNTYIDKNADIDNNSINFYNFGKVKRWSKISENTCEQEQEQEQVQIQDVKQKHEDLKPLIIYTHKYNYPELEEKIELIPISENVLLQEELEETKRRNKELKFIQEEMLALKDVMSMMCTLVYGQGEKLERIEEATSATVINVEKAAENIKGAHIELKKHKKKKVAMIVGAVSGGILGGLLLGGVGMLTGGIVPAIIATGVGIGVGSGVGVGTGALT